MIGILGGTFDPPHNGHLALAQGAMRGLGLDEIVFLLTAKPGHRACIEDADTREELARAAFGDVAASRFERDEHPFTVDAVRGGRFGDAVLLVGADQGAAFPTWREPDEILRWVKLGVGSRSGYEPPQLEQYGDRVLLFRFASPPISASMIRDLVARGQPIDGYVPPAVAELIANKRLYRSAG